MTITVKMVNDFIYYYTKSSLNCNDIADKYNVSSTTVRKYLRLNNIPMLKHKGTRHSYNDFYKNKYSIALYDLEDNLFQVFDNAYDMAHWMGKSLNSTYCCLNDRQLHKKIRYKGNWYKKVLIEE